MGQRVGYLLTAEVKIIFPLGVGNVVKLGLDCQVLGSHLDT